MSDEGGTTKPPAPNDGGGGRAAGDEESMMRCSACCKSGDDLKMCNACKSVRYCSVTCQKAHRKAHRKECRLKERELKTKELRAFAQRVSDALADASAHIDLSAPPPPKEECPICLIPMPLVSMPASGAVYFACCGNKVCNGCIHENQKVIDEVNVKRTIKKLPLQEHCCPFCRAPKPPSFKETTVQIRKRMELNDPQAFLNMGLYYNKGIHGLPKDELVAFELMLRAAELGSAEACHNIGISYVSGTVVEEDAAKAREYFELAAKRGSHLARYYLGKFEVDEDNYEVATKHFRIAAEAGHTESLNLIRKGFDDGIVSKADYFQVLRAYKKAQDEQWSKEREEYLKLKPW